jgi:uncharacterized protein YjdB
VSPAAATVVAGSTAAFSATVTGSVDTRVVWTVVEAGGGTIDADGTYAAPGTPGGYHVVATSVADAGASGRAAVTVVPPVAVAISPRAPTVAAGGTLSFTATVTNATDPGVTWSVAGSSCGTVTQAGVYTAPQAAATCTVSAASREDPARSDSATVTVTAPPGPVEVTVTPSIATVDACQPLQLSAAVANASDRGVTWSVREGVEGGTVDGSGLYVAPSAAGSYHVVATSVADPARSATVTISVIERILSVTVTPPSAAVRAGATVQFTATVTTTCGAFPSVAAAPGR